LAKGEAARADDDEATGPVAGAKAEAEPQMAARTAMDFMMSFAWVSLY
jgi:hypothetical protein